MAKEQRDELSVATMYTAESDHYPEQQPHGPYLDKFFPDVYSLLAKTNSRIRQIYKEVDLPSDLIELVCVRASQLNGCATCLSIHVPAARAAGVSDIKLDVLAAWRETDLFNPAERAALELCETLTLLPEGQRSADAPLRAMSVFAEEQVAALEWCIVLINTFNRISIASGHPPVRNSRRK